LFQSRFFLGANGRREDSGSSNGSIYHTGNHISGHPK
jgi:hypothetical protein